jgi:hypothetical protein
MTGIESWVALFHTCLLCDLSLDLLVRPPSGVNRARAILPAHFRLPNQGRNPVLTEECRNLAVGEGISQITGGMVSNVESFRQGP